MEAAGRHQTVVDTGNQHLGDGPKPRPRPDYPFEAFLADLDELTTTGALPPGPFHGIPVAALPHFRSKYASRRVRVFRYTRFMLAMSYIAEHFRQFDTEDFAVYGSDRVGGLVSEPLLRAVHQTFSVNDVFGLKGSPDPADMLALARELRTATPGPAHRAIGV